MTNPDVITPKLVESLLKEWQGGNFKTNDLNTIAALTPNLKTTGEQKFQIQELLYQLVTQHLSATLVASSINPEEEKIISALESLFQEKPSNQQFFTLIYCRYLNIRQYQVQELAEITHITTRSLRRYLVKGFSILSAQIKSALQNSNPARKDLKEHFPMIEAERVIGMMPLLTQLNSILNQKDAHHAISIEGIGGIGKTLLTEHLLKERYQTNAHDDYVWVSARQDELSFRGEINPVENFVTSLDDIVSRLAQNLGQNHLAGLSTEDKLNHLKHFCEQKRLLIIIDNLETVEEVDKLVPTLLKLGGQTKIIFTSRQSLSQYPSVRIFRIPELSFENSYTLVLNELKRLGLQLSVKEETVRELYGITGGIPLVLKLASAQFGETPAKEIIHQLRLGKENSQNMYSYIYRQAWRLLTDIGKELLLVMLLVSPDGEDREWICEMSELTEKNFRQGVEALKRLSLIEISGSIEAPRYRIHRLTTTFLKTDILQNWEAE